MRRSVEVSSARSLSGQVVGGSSGGGGSLTTELRSFLLSRISCSIWFRCSIIRVRSYVYAEMSLSC